MPSTQPFQPTWDFASDPAPQSKVNADALQTQFTMIAAWTVDALNNLAVSIRDDDTLSDALVRFRNLHPEILNWFQTNLVPDRIFVLPVLNAAVRVATTANVALTGNIVVDGVTLANGDRVLVKDQATASQNGLYIFNSSGAWTRATDLPTGNPIGYGWGVIVREGAVNANFTYAINTDSTSTGVVGTDAMTFYTPTGTYPLAIALGGTGADNAADALTNLGAVSSADLTAHETNVVVDATPPHGISVFGGSLAATATAATGRSLLGAAPLTHVGSTDPTLGHPLATGSTNGFLSATDKLKLDGLTGGVGDMLTALVQSTIAATTTPVSLNFGTLYYVSGTAANYAINLPTAAGNTRKILAFKVLDVAVANKTYTLTAFGAETIDAAATVPLIANDVAILVSDGAGWRQIMGRQTAAHGVQAFSAGGSFVVPAGVTQIRVKAWGAGGTADANAGEFAAGGGGAHVDAFFAVDPGETATVSAGSAGNTTLSIPISGVKPARSLSAGGGSNATTTVAAAGGTASVTNATYSHTLNGAVGYIEGSTASGGDAHFGGSGGHASTAGRSRGEFPGGGAAAADAGPTGDAGGGYLTVEW